MLKSVGRPGHEEIDDPSRRRVGRVLPLPRRSVLEHAAVAKSSSGAPASAHALFHLASAVSYVSTAREVQECAGSGVSRGGALGARAPP